MNTLKIAMIAFLGVALVSSVPVGKEGGNRRLIKTSENDFGKWLTQEEIFALIKQDQHFIDITDLDVYPNNEVSQSVKAEIPRSLRHQDVVNEAIANISLPRIEAFLQNFTNLFHNRYYNSQHGVDSEKYLLEEVRSRVEGYAGSASVVEFEHPNWMQNSIIARLEGADPSLRAETVIVGAHQDSLNIQGSSLRAPGADDNASGCIALLEALRAIVSNGIILNRTVEFHWYAAEEAGLLGSREIARSYKNRSADVIGMMNYDVVGYYVAGNDDVAIITDYVDGDLTQFLRILVDGYLDFGRRERACGYACSDHAAWTEVGYPASRPTQAVRNPQMHTLNDTIETVSFVQVREFVKLAVGFLVELAEPVNSKV